MNRSTAAALIAVALASAGCATTSIQTVDRDGKPVVVKTGNTTYDLGRIENGGAQRISQADVDRCVARGEEVFWQKGAAGRLGSLDGSIYAGREFDDCMKRLGYRLKS